MLAELKGDDGPCKYVLECVFSPGNRQHKRLNEKY
jgi:hypothetical protein